MSGLYIHIPFCSKKCSYCDFISFGGKIELLPPYLHALKNEALNFSGENIETVFVGGGTPSLMSPNEICDLFDFLNKNFKIKTDCEISFESNPQSVTLEKLKALKDSGVNRISVGAQSLSDDTLKSIGRSHTLKEFETAIENIKKAGFDNFNLDLIFALPGQTLEMWENTLEKALSYDSTHISCYSLILDEKTPMGAAYAKGEFSVPDEETERLMYKSVGRVLAPKNIFQYEVSNYAKKGFECKHNINYWKCREYIGLGCAAHSYYNGARYCNTSRLEEYIKQENIVRDKQILTKTDMLEEFFMLGLRMKEGISLEEFESRFEQNFFYRYKKQIDELTKLKLILIENNRLFLTEKGMDLCDSVVLEFI